jgi:hypothetical protein
MLKSRTVYGSRFFLACESSTANLAAQSVPRRAARRGGNAMRDSGFESERLNQKGAVYG